MNRVSIELVARDPETLEREVEDLRACVPGISTINIPDLMRFDLRSWDAAAQISGRFGSVIPHIRAIDIDPGKPLPGVGMPDLTEILVVQGDPPTDLNHRTFPNTSETIIRRYRREAPHLSVYAAFDPYRRAPYRELEDVDRKKDAGARGFFTQPVFDSRMLDMCRDWLRDEQVFWGFSPVIGPKSRSYWETTNHVVFPRNFEPTLEANIAFAETSIRDIRDDGGNVYLMPVRVKLASYLGPLARVLTG
ncbi:methylenetetrahydrofolate reductase [Acetobacter oeni]|uniref:Methylenetetrahydrofolate reductase n=1 Tax=Acetobacter oeni TaxID=304077 RepID=A0A511XJW1_9PROT|nr:methylenetetrahydrofolate reductase [Acetobacter oeni]MBB3883438.1 methylenetetrahydrofolate reductase (NADPH) [Acetobacter oeni]NHO19410.1 methylenetetrahydrofolate reductase [Acetobacter oeni]GBR04021.1 5,10-methylenetetrahydrofolate reductase [Acetobacter oeni LMG 21952]GEN63219.1 methylenetetrahydrofolate reductase [Acetobacter oeni]